VGLSLQGVFLQIENKVKSIQTPNPTLAGGGITMLVLKEKRGEASSSVTTKEPKIF
jgi:hypothetical protein